MKILLATVLIIVGGFMSYVAIGGFLEKQSKEEKAQTYTAKTQADPSTGATAPPATTASSGKSYTTKEVATHNNSSDCWLIIDNKVYSVNKYITDHPGGASAIIDYCGKEASQAFATQNRGGSHSSQARSLLGDYEIGILKN